jgi:hypothetical protein
MFEKANPVSASIRPAAQGRHAEDGARLRPISSGASSALSAERFDARSLRRAGDALRAVEWSELTARLNAARDLRLLMRNESQTSIEDVAASFGDAAASYFALLDDGEPGVNPDALGHPKALGDIAVISHSTGTADDPAEATHGDTREMQ